MTERNEDRRQLDESKTNLPELAAAVKRAEELKADWQKFRQTRGKELTAKIEQRRRLKNSANYKRPAFLGGPRSTSKKNTAVKTPIPASTSWAKNAFKTVGRAAMGPWALGASIFLDPTSTGGKKIAFKYSGRKGKYDAMFPPEKVIRSDEFVPHNTPSDKELGRVYNKNVADYEKKNQQLKRKQPDAGTVWLANEKAKFRADLADRVAARNIKQNKKYLAPTRKDVLPGVKAWSTREKDYSAKDKKHIRAVSKISKNAAYSKLLDDNPELRKSMLAQTSVPWKHTPTTATPHDASMRMPSARDNAKFKAVDQRLPSARDNAKFKAVDQRLPSARDNAKFKAVDTARPGEVDFLGQREAAKKKKRSEAIQRWYTDNAKFKAVDTARPGEVDFLGQREAAKKKKRSEALQRWYTDYIKNRSLSKK